MIPKATQPISSSSIAEPPTYTQPQVQAQSSLSGDARALKDHMGQLRPLLPPELFQDHQVFTHPDK